MNREGHYREAERHLGYAQRAGELNSATERVHLQYAQVHAMLAQAAIVPPPEPDEEPDGPEILDAEQAAGELGVDSATLREFLRWQGKGVGSGNRYEIFEYELPDLDHAFKQWFKANEGARS